MTEPGTERTESVWVIPLLPGDPAGARRLTARLPAVDATEMYTDGAVDRWVGQRLPLKFDGATVGTATITAARVLPDGCTVEVELLWTR